MGGNIEEISDSTALYDQGRSLMKAERFDEAIRAFQESNNLLPHFKTLELLGECLIHQGRLDEAIPELLKSVELNNGVRSPSLLAEVYHALGHNQRASEMADIALARDSTNRIALKVKSDLEQAK